MFRRLAADAAAAPGAASSAVRSGASGSALGPEPPNDSICSGPDTARAARVISRRESTWPASSAARAPGKVPIRELPSNWLPAARRAARSAARACWNAAAPSGATARTSIRSSPEPKLAITSGAYTLARRPPNWLRTAAVAITTSEPSGSVAADRSTSRFPAVTPWASSAEHMAGSQATIAPPLTWLATQAAA
jgi:hypothetical protein